MADRKQHARLKWSIAEWNRWRREDCPEERPDLSDANLVLAFLDRANLRGSDLRNANLHGANLREADLAGTDLRWANLNNAEVAGADFAGALVDRTVFANNDLHEARGLEAVQHFGPSTIGVDTIYKSRGRIPEAFLRGAGVPENLVTFMRSLVGNPIEYYSCFISHSSKDHEFAACLHADLQAKGVRCWFAPEDLKIGDRFRDRIDESIRLHDKLLLVLSEQSIASAWVRREVEAALDREDRQKGLVLFPIRLDDAIDGADEAWAREIKRSRHIGEFTEWKNHDSYQKAFDRLLRDLKAEAAKG